MLSVACAVLRMAPRKAAFGNWVINWEIDMRQRVVKRDALRAALLTRLIIQSDLVINYPGIARTTYRGVYCFERSRTDGTLTLAAAL